YNGYALEVARHSGVPVRITHSHNDTSALDSESGSGRKLFMKSARYLQSISATDGIAVSEGAARSLFGEDWQDDTRWSVLYTSIVPERFDGPNDRARIRREFGVAEDAFVVGHVGRFSEQKNHGFLIEIFAEIVRLAPDARLVLVGEGLLRAEVEEALDRFGVRDRAIMTGTQKDPERLMRGLMDVFVLPSLHEGLPLVGIEAQASGLPFFFSDAIPGEVNALPELARPLPLSLSASEWAEQILAVRYAPPKLEREEALRRMKNSPFNISHAVKRLEEIYGERP
ncbi:MAG: glycosyltransferase, partial [Rubrobacter sp.]